MFILVDDLMINLDMVMAVRKDNDKIHLSFLADKGMTINFDSELSATRAYDSMFSNDRVKKIKLKGLKKKDVETSVENTNTNTN